MTNSEIVEAFLDSAEECLEALAEQYPSSKGPGWYLPLKLLDASSGMRVRKGRLKGIGRFTLHGYGCRFELSSGALVDLDWDAEGRAILDSWRLWSYARSVGKGELDRESLRLAASTNPRLILASGGWFTWADGSFTAKEPPNH